MALRENKSQSKGIRQVLEAINADFVKKLRAGGVSINILSKGPILSNNVRNLNNLSRFSRSFNRVASSKEAGNIINF